MMRTMCESSWAAGRILTTLSKTVRPTRTVWIPASAQLSARSSNHATLTSCGKKPSGCSNDRSCSFTFSHFDICQEHQRWTVANGNGGAVSSPLT